MTSGKQVTINITLPEDVVEGLDARAKRIGVSRAKFVGDVLAGSCVVMDEMLSPNADASVPITIGFSPEAIRDHGRAAKILNTTPSVLISRSLEIGQLEAVETVREFEREQGLADDKVH